MKLIKKIVNVIFDVLLVFLIIVLLFILFSIFYAKKQGFSNRVDVFGYCFYIDVSNSMSPVINKGDLLVAKKVAIEDLKKDDIIIYFDEEDDISITHRIVSIDGNKKQLVFKTKGDNNQNSDFILVNKDNYEAKYIFRIKGLGNVFLFLKSVYGILFMSTLMVALVLFFVFWKLIKRKYNVS